MKFPDLFENDHKCFEQVGMRFHFLLLKLTFFINYK